MDLTYQFLEIQGPKIVVLKLWGIKISDFLRFGDVKYSFSEVQGRTILIFRGPGTKNTDLLEVGI